MVKDEKIGLEAEQPPETPLSPERSRGPEEAARTVGEAVAGEKDRLQGKIKDWEERLGLPEKGEPEIIGGQIIEAAPVRGSGLEALAEAKEQGWLRAITAAAGEKEDWDVKIRNVQEIADAAKAAGVPKEKLREHLEGLGIGVSLAEEAEEETGVGKAHFDLNVGGEVLSVASVLPEVIEEQVTEAAKEDEQTIRIEPDQWTPYHHLAYIGALLMHEGMAKGETKEERTRKVNEAVQEALNSGVDRDDIKRILVFANAGIHDTEEQIVARGGGAATQQREAFEAMAKGIRGGALRQRVETLEMRIKIAKLVKAGEAKYPMLKGDVQYIDDLERSLVQARQDLARQNV